MEEVALIPRKFIFEKFPISVVEIDGCPWWIASEVAEYLGYRMASDLTRRLKPHQKGTRFLRTPGGPQNVSIISEGGLFKSILNSSKPEAQAFESWVTDVLLPTIRRTGRYEVANGDPPKGRVLDLEGALGTQDDRHAIKTALLTVQMYTDLYGQQAGRDMMAKLGFPVPEVDLPPAPAPAKGGGKAVEGDIHHWGSAVGIKHSKRDATHLRDLFESYTKWCGTQGQRAMHPDRFKAMILTLFGHEEHPEMVCAVITRRI